MFKYLIELVLQEENRYRKKPDAYKIECQEYTTKLSSHFSTPSNRVNAYMALSIMVLSSCEEVVSPDWPIILSGSNWFGAVRYLWTSMMLLGWIVPHKKFNHDSVATSVYDISREALARDIKAQLGWFSRFSKASLYQTEFQPLLNQSEIKRFLDLCDAEITKKHEEQEKQKTYAEETRLADEKRRLLDIEIAKVQEKQNAMHAEQDAIRAKSEALLWACRQNNLSMHLLDYHLAHEAQIDYQDSYGNTALLYLIKYGNDRLAEYLLKKGANPCLANHLGETAITLVSKQSLIFMMLKDQQLARWMQYPPPIIQLNKSLHEEICSISPKVQNIQQLLNIGAEINYQDEHGYTGLMFAIDHENERITRYLLDQGADPLLKNKYAKVASALIATSSPIFKMLKGYELLQASTKNDLPKVMGCLSSGADINFQSSRGMTPLLVAVEQGFVQLTTFLLSRDADLTIISQEEKGVLELVTDEEIEKLLRRALNKSEPSFSGQEAPTVSKTEQDHVLTNLLHKSASDPAAALRVAEIYEQGKHGVSSSLLKALDFYIQASRLGEPKASFYLGSIFESGTNEIMPDAKQAFSYYACAARQCHPSAKAHLEQLAHSGNAQAQFALGYEYYQETAQHTLDAVYWCVCAAIQEHEQALSYLYNTQFDAEIYFKIAHQYESAKQNLTMAIEFYVKAIELNHKNAAMQLACFYLIDHGEIKKDKNKAFSYYLKAATLGQLDALIPLERLCEEMGAQEQSALADFYRSIRNYEKAAYWTTKALPETELVMFSF